MFRHALADAAARAAAPLGAAFTLLALVTGSLWGRPEWGTWWVWDARLTSVLVLFLLFIGYIALRAAIDDEARAGRAAAILALVGLVNLPIVKFSVDWWNSLHQGESIFRKGGPTIALVFLIPLAFMGVGYLCAFAALWLERTRAEVWRRRAQALELQAAGACDPARQVRHLRLAGLRGDRAGVRLDDPRHVAAGAPLAPAAERLEEGRGAP